jgi:3-phosphoshikimate 1-carboxyvinyltransferase
MIIRVSTSTLRGEVQAPPSKSVMQRLVAGALLAEGTSTLHNISQSDDCTAALLLAAQLGAEIELDEQSARIIGTGGKLRPRAGQLAPGESGLAARLFTPIAGLAHEPLEIIAERSLSRRPMHPYEGIFKALGGELSTTNGAFPVNVLQRLAGGEVNVDASLSSQFLSGLLFALPGLTIPSSITVSHPTSTPYLTMTLEVLADFGIAINADEDFQGFHIPAGQQFQHIETVVDGDWSGAAALAVAAMVAAESSVAIHGLQNQYTQADEAIRGALLFAGGALSGIDGGIQVARRPVRGFNIDLTHAPDLFPVLAALAAFGKRPSKLKGIARLIHKESNRAECIETSWRQLGIPVELDVEKDTMTVSPWPIQNRACGMKIDPSGDHRMAMALSILALGSNGYIDIPNAECVAKSYPEFFDDLESLQAHLKLIQQ